MYDPAIARWMAVDPLTELTRRWSPYTYCYNNPLIFVDPDGMFSTHTDQDGKVIAVKDDGDLGVYKHDGCEDEAKENFEKNYSENNTSANGEKMGETLTPLGFADFDIYAASGGETIVPGQGARIDFNSDWATTEVNNILNADPSALEYASKAGKGGEWDIKAHSFEGWYYGSKLNGKYASARDAGNFAAGAVAQNSVIPNSDIDYGFGVYNQ